MCSHVRDSADAGTVGDYFSSVIHDWQGATILAWPPDVFCLLAALLQKTGAYIRLVDRWPAPGGRGKPAEQLERWKLQTQQLAEEWWRFASAKCHGQKVPLPRKLRTSWGVVVRGAHIELNSLRAAREAPEDSHGRFWAAVFNLLAAADEACCGAGFNERSPSFYDDSKYEGLDFLYFARVRLQQSNRESGRSTLCSRVPTHFAVVLPKNHTPQTGITLRSVSHHLAFVRTHEVDPRFIVLPSSLGHEPLREDGRAASPKASHALNLLLVPWPKEVRPVDFQEVKCTRQAMDGGYGFFTYEPHASHKVAPDVHEGNVRDLIRQARARVGPVHGVVFPEAALMEGEVDRIVQEVWAHEASAFVVAGVASPGKPGTYGTNKARLSLNYLDRFRVNIDQHKHHRWQLDAGQIENYGLGGQLDPERRWWEHIAVPPRSLAVASISQRVTMSVLICEDLARQDPVAEVVRSVGPNLVVALLMDGPQLAERWPAHYASVLADDPGSSVLTFTSIGMTELSRPRAKPPSRVIGLWRDRFRGVCELHLPAGADALAVTLTIRNAAEFTADGRKDARESNYLLLNGYQPIYLAGKERT